MLVIYAEKADVANKIAAALCGFRLPDGTNINFKNLAANKKAVEAFQKNRVTWISPSRGSPAKLHGAMDISMD